MAHARIWTAVVGLIIVSAVAAMPAVAPDAEIGRWQAAGPEVRSAVLTLARRAFDTYARKRVSIDSPPGLPPLLLRRAGVFVSTMRNGAPRCCMGTLYPQQPDAAREIIANAAAAVAFDRRFAPIRPNELKDLVLIVSVVSRPLPITEAEAKALDPARDGLAVQYADRFGVILSGETDSVNRMIHWGRIRAGAPANAPIRLYRLEDVRFMENY
jgi:AMMECR1 domain-containing protein